MTDAATGPEISFVDAKTLAGWIESGEAVVFDVREENEWQRARIAGATLVPLSAFDVAAVTAPEAAPETAKIVLHCHSGVRCGMAAELLADAGVTRPLWRLEGGIVAWAQAGNPIDQG